MDGSIVKGRVQREHSASLKALKRGINQVRVGLEQKALNKLMMNFTSPLHMLVAAQAPEMPSTRTCRPIPAESSG
jgi:hypothetical protein